MSGDMASDTYVALLRGINVGGKNILPMADLRALCTAAGCRDVRTYIQSGNVVFRADSTVAAALSASVPARIAAQFGLQVPVIVRSAAQMAAVIRDTPFLAQGAAIDALHVLFLGESPTAARLASLDADRSSPDAFAVRGQEIYLHLPNGAGRTRLTNAYFDTMLATTSTGRNWRTVLRLFAMMTD